MDIICFSTCSWDVPNWTNKQHIMSRLAKRHRVLYVSPHPWPLRHGSGILRAVMPNVHETHTGFLLPGSRFRPVRKFSDMISPAILRRVMKHVGFSRPLVWVYRIEAVEMLDRIGPTGPVLYDCVDPYAAMPDYSGPRALRAKELERRLMARADQTVVTSRALYEDNRDIARRIALVHNVGDYEHFAKASGSLPVPGFMRSLSRPVITFTGAVSDYKLDFQMILDMARSHPDWSVLLIGPVGEGDSSTDVSELARQPNIHLAGPKPYAELPACLAASDVCMIPYRLNDYTRGCFPLKFFEYMATGKPVVITALPALADFAHLAETVRHGDLAGAVSRAIEEDTPEKRNARIEAARCNTWETRIDGILRLLRELPGMETQI